MARPEKYTADTILDASRSLVVESGPAAMTMTAVAGRLGAPSGSLYHRFAGRSDLAATLWLRCVERFQEGYLRALGQPNPYRGAREAARHVVTWSRGNLDDARVLLLFRSSDLVHGDWPEGLRHRNIELQQRLSRGLTHLETGLGVAGDVGRRRVRFAVVEVPYAAVRTSLVDGVLPPPSTEALVDETVACLLQPLIADTERNQP